MPTGHVFIATSLDGFIARKNHALDWLPTEEAEGEDMGYKTFVDGVDGLIMGRNSFETVLQFGEWPYEKPVVVLSKSLREIPAKLEGKVRLSSREPKELMDSLGKEGWERVYVDGGQIVQSFLRAGLIQEITITVVPILLGEGVRLFGELEGDLHLELVRYQGFRSGLVQSQYRLRCAT